MNTTLGTSTSSRPEETTWSYPAAAVTAMQPADSPTACLKPESTLKTVGTAVAMITITVTLVFAASLLLPHDATPVTPGIHSHVR